MTMRGIHSRMAIAGHPIHPVLVHLPAAALMGLVGTDIAYWYTEDVFWARAGLWLAGVGAAGGWLSGVIGFLDLVLVPRIRRLITAWCHALFAVMLLSMASLNWSLRLADAAVIVPWGLALSVLTGVLIGVAGFLGGQLVYEYAVGVDVEEAEQTSLPQKE